MKLWGHQLMKLLSGVALCAIAVTLPSCLEEFNEIKDADPFRYNPAVAVPLVQSRLNLRDFITNGDVSTLIEVGDDGLITLVYREELGTLEAPALEVPDQRFGESISLEEEISSAVPITATLTNQETFTHELDLRNGDELDSIHIKSGVIEVLHQSEFSADRRITVTFFSLRKDGVPLQMILESGANEFGPQGPVVADLSDYTLDLTQLGSTSNTLTYEVKIELSFDNVPFILQEVGVDVTIKDLALSGFFGKMDQRTLVADADTLEVDIFDFAQEATMQFADPRLDFVFDNGIGLPIEIDFKSLSSSTVAGASTQAQGEVVSNQTIIEAPPLSQIGSTVQSKISFNRDNSNLVDFLSKAPNLIVLGYEAILNPGSEGGRFLVEGNTLSAAIELRLPLNGLFSNFTLQNSFGFSGTDLNDIDSYLVRFSTNNGFPFQIDLQVYWLDENGVVLDSSFTEGTELVPAAAVDANGEVISSIVKTTDIVKSSEEIELMRQAKSIRIRAKLSEKEAAKILDGYFLGLKLGAQAVLDL